MRILLIRIWAYISSLFISRGKLGAKAKALADSAHNALDKMKKKKKKPRWRIGTIIWDAMQLGAYKRKTPKIGRNAQCPCGKPRIAPRDTTLRAKYKHCCGAL